MKWPAYIKLIGLLLFGLCSEGISQDILSNQVSIQFSIGTREQFIDTIKQQTNARFLYTDLVNINQTDTLRTGVYLLSQLLDSIFIDSEINYTVRDGLIILSPKSINNDSLSKILITGLIYSKKNRPIPFATIYLKKNSKGTISNAEGRFRLVLPQKNTKDTLIVSSMGYEVKELLPHEYLSNYLEIKLKPTYIPIKDVIVRPNDPEKLVMQSFEAIRNNYSNNTSLMRAFFRESSKQNNDYISLTEALIEINKSSYISSSNDLVRLVKGRNGTNIIQSELVNIIMEGGLYNGLRLDIVKYGSYFYGNDALENCDYRFIKTTFYKSRQTYIVGFDMKEGLKYAGYKGRMYIDAENLALVRAEFELSPEGMSYARSSLIRKTPKGFKVRPLFAKYEVEYRLYNNIWNLQYARSTLGIKTRKVKGKHNKGYSCDFVSTAEFVITENIENSRLNIKYREAAKSSDILVKQVENTSADFWLDDNVIVPEEPLLNTIEKLRQKGVLPIENE